MTDDAQGAAERNENPYAPPNAENVFRNRRTPAVQGRRFVKPPLREAEERLVA